MNILVFETNELLVTGDDLNNLECLNTDNFLESCDEDFVMRDDGGIECGFEPGDYRLYRPNHVSKVDPCLGDLSIFKL